LGSLGPRGRVEGGALALGYGAGGYPVGPGFAEMVRPAEPLLREWPGSAALYLPPPEPNRLFRNHDLAATYRRLVEESRGGSREDEIERARDVWYRGFVADACHRMSERYGGLLTGDDLASYAATIERPVSYEFRGTTVCKAGPWSQAPVFLQQLALLDGFDLEGMGFGSVDYIHTVIECAKLAFADREAFYGDPDFVDVPLERLISSTYNDERRRLVLPTASSELPPRAA